MDGSTNQSNLKRGLAIVKNAVAGKSTVPALSHVQIKTDEGRLRLAATDLRIGMIAWLEATIESEFAVCLPFDLLNDVVGALPDKPIQYWFTEQTQSVRLLCTDEHEFMIKGIESAEFPTLPLITEAPLVVLPSDQLARALDAVTYATGSDDTRPILAAVHIRIERDRVIFSATDGFRAGRAVVNLPEPIDGWEKPIELCPQGNPLADLATILRGQQAVPVALRALPDGGFVSFEASGVAGVDRLILLTRLIEGQYPELDRMIPSSYVARVVVDRAALLNRVKLAGFFANAAGRIIRLSYADRGAELGQITITANAAEVGDQKGVVEAIVHGPAGRSAVNVQFIQESLTAIEADRVAIELQGEQFAVVFRPVGDEDTKHILMPMTVKD
jgi:DNA polymerase-3 subunit beta